MSYSIYVSATVSKDGNFAACTYYTNADGKDEHKIDSSRIQIPVNSGDCIFQQIASSDLTLIGATFKTLGSSAGMNLSNFSPATDENAISFSMPATPIIKGVVLLFSTRGTVQNLYPSIDPEVQNDGPPTMDC